MMNAKSLLMLMLLLPAAAHADGVLISWGPNMLEGVTASTFELAKTRPAHEILANNKNAASWPDAYLALVGAREHQFDQAFLVTLTSQLTDRAEVKLAKTSRLIIWERIASGDILFEGKGLQVSDDLFTVAGRANWILRTITGKNFGYVKPAPREEDLLALQKKWRKYLSDGELPGFTEPYPTEVKGLEEIRSKEALHALIVSLQSSDAAYTHTYLAKLTSVAEPHDAQWWSDWWTVHERGLVWDPKSGSFRQR